MWAVDKKIKNMKLIKKVVAFFDWIDDGLRKMYGIDNKNLGRKKWENF